MTTSHPRLAAPGGIRPDRALPATPTWWSRLFDGAQPWGSFDAMVGRYGVRRYRLIIFPPGTSAADRCFARLWRGWPVGGAVLGLLAVMLLGDAVFSARTVLEVAVTAYVGIGAILFVLAGDARTAVRSLSVVLMPGSIDPPEQRMFTEWQALVDILTHADRLLAAGAIAPAEYRAVWSKAYKRIGIATVG